MNLYVGNISYRLTDEDLGEAFSEFGEVVSAKIIKDKFSGRSRGFGFVEMSDEKSGQDAIEKLNGSELDGRSLVVSQAKSAEGNK
tara:strand:+ start:369 stop:623 length:255 start_codon:yes stop_codon:yes gene_type:complete